jgi:hypothetical protein
MPNKTFRSKGDFMPRKRKSVQSVKEAETAATTAVAEAQPETSAGPQADMPVEPQPVTVVEPVPSEPPHTFVERLGEKNTRRKMPDPFVIALDNEAGVSLCEIKRYGVMAILFQDWPTQPVIDLLEKKGYRWDEMDYAWNKPVREHAAMATRIEAERLYQKVRQMIRQEKGVDAVQDIPF